MSHMWLQKRITKELEVRRRVYASLKHQLRLSHVISGLTSSDTMAWKSSNDGRLMTGVNMTRPSMSFKCQHPPRFDPPVCLGSVNLVAKSFLARKASTHIERPFTPSPEKSRARGATLRPSIEEA